MRSFLLTGGKLLALATMLGAAGTAYASDGTVTFEGEITSQTCTINGGTPDFTVTLPTVSTSALPAVGDTAARTPFAIALTACTPDSGTVSAYFEPGPNTDAVNDVLSNDTGTSAGVAIQLLNDTSGIIALGDPFATQNGTTAALATGAATLNYFAEYKRTGAVTAGTVVTSTLYSIVYQ